MLIALIICIAVVVGGGMTVMLAQDSSSKLPSLPSKEYTANVNVPAPIPVPENVLQNKCKQLNDQLIKASNTIKRLLITHRIKPLEVIPDIDKRFYFDTQIPQRLFDQFYNSMSSGLFMPDIGLGIISQNDGQQYFYNPSKSSEQDEMSQLDFTPFTVHEKTRFKFTERDVIFGLIFDKKQMYSAKCKNAQETKLFMKTIIENIMSYSRLMYQCFESKYIQLKIMHEIKKKSPNLLNDTIIKDIENISDQIKFDMITQFMIELLNLASKSDENAKSLVGKIMPDIITRHNVSLDDQQIYLNAVASILATLNLSEKA